jgi:hypothetical protein
MFGYTPNPLRQRQERIGGAPRELEFSVGGEACAGPEILFDPVFHRECRAFTNRSERLARLRSKCRNGEMPANGISHAAEDTATERDE